MEGKTTVGYGCGSGFLGLLTILFIALKMTGYIDWHWLLVLSPMIVGMLIGITIVALVIIATIVTAVLEKKQ